MPAASRPAAAVLIAVAVAVACGRLISAQLVYEPHVHRENNPQDQRRGWPSIRPRPTPMFGSNDRSRWATIRALVDEGTYVIGRRDMNTLYATAVLPLAAATPFDV